MYRLPTMYFHTTHLHIAYVQIYLGDRKATAYKKITYLSKVVYHLRYNKRLQQTLKVFAQNMPW